VSTIPAAVDALVDVARAALPDARVDDGLTVFQYERSTEGVSTGVSIGWDENGPAVEAEIDREWSDGAGSDREIYRIYSSLFKSFGDIEAPPLREACFTDYEAIKAVLRDRRPLAPGVLVARMQFVDYEARAVEGGWEGRLRFTVQVTAFDR